MSSETKYRDRLRELGLTEEQGKDLIAALQSIAESLLNKKYMLRRYDDEEGTIH